MKHLKRNTDKQDFEKQALSRHVGHRAPFYPSLGFSFFGSVLGVVLGLFRVVKFGHVQKIQ